MSKDKFLYFSYFCDNYMSIQKQRVYPVNREIKMNMVLTNNLKFDCELQNLEISPKNENIEIKSPIKNIISLNQSFRNIFEIKKGTEFTIPLILQIKTQYSGLLGLLNLFWTDHGLSSYDSSINNPYELVLPEIDVKKFEIILDYEIPKTLNCKKEIQFKILIHNLSEEFKKIVFLIDNSPNFTTSGNVKKKLVIYPDETKDITLSIIPLSYGRLKLPPFKIMEFPLASTSYENKIYSIYYLPDHIQVNGS